MTWSAPSGADQIQVARARHAGDLGAERLGDLHGERADAARRADDQHVLAGLYACACRAPPAARRPLRSGTVAASSNERFAGLRRELRRAGRPRTRRRTRRSFRRPRRPARTRSTLRADGRDGPRQTPTGVRRLGPAQPEADRSDQVGEAGHEVPGASIHAGRSNPHEDLVVARAWASRPGRDGAPPRVRAVRVLHDRAHRLHGSSLVGRLAG